MKISNKYKAIPFWSWNEKLDDKRLIDQIKWMDNVGIGGFFMHARSGLTTPYLSKEWFKAIDVSKREAKKRNMEAYAYDENGWPSGFVGGKLLKDKRNLDSFLTYKITKYDPKSLASYDISGKKIKRVKKGNKVLNVYLNLTNSTVDICQKRVVNQFIKLTHEEYYKRDKSHDIKGFFTDEPQLYRWNTFYSRALPEYFKKVYKEDILDRLGLLFVENDGYRDFRYKYCKALQTLMLENFAKPIYDWCDSHNYKLTGHYVEESSLLLQMQCSCGIMPFYEYEHIPGCDWLSRNTKFHSLEGKQLGSVAQQLGKKQVLSEMFAGCGWDVTPLELKHIAEYLYVDGINLMCHHLLPFNERGNRKRDYPSHFDPINPWVNKNFKEFNDYFTNLGYTLANSRVAINVAMLHPIRSCYFDYKHPVVDPTNSLKALEDSLFNNIKLLDDMHIPFHFLDETILAKHGKAKGKEIACGLCSYKYLILPKIYTMDKSTEKIIHKFVNAGGKVLLLDQVPTYLEGKEHKYSYLKSNTNLKEIKYDQNFISTPNSNFRLSYRIDKEKNPFIYVVNIGEKSTLNLKFKNYKFLTDKKEYYDGKISFEKYESKILYPSKIKGKKNNKNSLLHLNKSFDVKTPVDNYLTLDTLAYSYDNKKYSSFMHHAAVFEEFISKKTNKILYLKYKFKVQNIPSICSALIEDTNTKEVYINNHKILMAKKDYFLNEYNIAKFIKKGDNEIVIKIHFYQDKNVYDVLFDPHANESLKNCLVYNTTIEPIYLRGNFGVYGDFKLGKNNNVVLGENFYIGRQKNKLTNLIKDGYPFFKGDITLSQIIEIKNVNQTLEINGRFHLIDVFVNKKFVKRLMFENKIDVSKFLKKGKNLITIVLTVSNRNLFGPFHYVDEEPLMVGPYTFERTGTWKNGESPLYKNPYALIKTII